MNANDIDKILRMLETQRFADWYNGQFTDYITGDMEHDTNISNQGCREIIKKKLTSLLGEPHEPQSPKSSTKDAFETFTLIQKSLEMTEKNIGKLEETHIAGILFDLTNAVRNTLLQIK